MYCMMHAALLSPACVKLDKRTIPPICTPQLVLRAQKASYWYLLPYKARRMARTYIDNAYFTTAYLLHNDG